MRKHRRNKLQPQTTHQHSKQQCEWILINRSAVLDANWCHPHACTKGHRCQMASGRSYSVLSPIRSFAKTVQRLI